MFVVFDLDGTLADCRHRVHFVRDGSHDWESFFSECVNDPPFDHALDVLAAMVGAGHRVEIWSARSDVVRTETRAWLARHGIDPDLLVHMRAAGDHTPDVSLKKSWLCAIHPDERPDLVFDDRQRVVDMWRDMGIPCFQVTANWENEDNRAIWSPVEPILTLMVGPSGGGKSTWVALNCVPGDVLSTDAIRRVLCCDESDQSRNDDVFLALHRVAKARLDSGLPTVIDATNLRRKDRLALTSLVPAGRRVTYVVVNRPLANKHATAGRRAGVVMADGKSLIDAHEQRFNSQLKDILRGDGLPNVTVLDARKFATGGLVPAGKLALVGEVAA